MKSSVRSAGVAFALLISLGDGLARSLGDHVLTSPCALDDDLEASSTSPPWPLVCLRGNAGTDLGLRLGDEQNDSYLNYAELYTGLHLLPNVSMHGRVRRYRLGRLYGQNPIIADEKPTDSFFVNFGNPALAHWRVAIGRFALPFGVDFRPLPRIYDELYKSEDFWRSPPHAFRLTWDDQSNAQVDLGVATRINPFERSSDPAAEKRGDDAVAMRAMFDLPALGGTRIVASAYGDREGDRRIGGAILNRGGEGSLTSLEWVRSWVMGQGYGVDERRQILRFNYQEDAIRNAGWLVEYEDELHRHWLTTIGHDFVAEERAAFRLSLSYRRVRDGTSQSHWLLVSGVQVRL